MRGKIQVGYLVSYDYEMLKNSLPSVYNEADTVFLAIDKNRKTWKGESFNIEDSFFEWLTTFDSDNKVELFEENFYVPELSAMECEVRERKMLSEKMGIGNWLIQVDSDEYFVDFKKFITDLRKYDSYLINPEKRPIQIGAFWLNLYKYTNDGILYVDKPHKLVVATNFPNYKWGRQTKQRVIYTNTILLHETLSRTEEGIKFKIENWGHSHEVNNDFLDKWKKVNENNYKEFSNFYYIEPERWKKLGYFPTKTLNEIKQYMGQNNQLRLSKSQLFFKNFGQWFKHLFK